MKINETDGFLTKMLPINYNFLKCGLPNPTELGEIWIKSPQKIKILLDNHFH